MGALLIGLALGHGMEPGVLDTRSGEWRPPLANVEIQGPGEDGVVTLRGDAEVWVLTEDRAVMLSLARPVVDLSPTPSPWLGLLGAFGVAMMGRRWLPLYWLAQLAAPGLALGGLALMVLGRQGLRGGARWPWAVAFLAGLALPAGSFGLEALALIPLSFARKPLAWAVGLIGGWALWC